MLSPLPGIISSGYNDIDNLSDDFNILIAGVDLKRWLI